MKEQTISRIEVKGLKYSYYKKLVSLQLKLAKEQGKKRVTYAEALEYLLK